MPMSPVDINNAVDYFANKNQTRLSGMIANGAAPLISTPTLASPQMALTANITKHTAALTAAQQAVGPARDKIIADWRGPAGRPNPLGWLLTMGHDGKGGTSIIDDVLASQGDTQAPQNLTQKILNLTGIGAYTSGEIAHKIGQNTADLQKYLSSGNVTPGGYAAQVGKGLIGDIGAAGTGIAEGFGARPTGQRPNTPGSDAQHVGITGAVDSAAAATALGVAGVFGPAAAAAVGPGNATVTPGTPQDMAAKFGNFAGGLTGFAADAVGDPLSWMGPTGLVKGLGAGAKAAADAVKAGDNALLAGAKGVKGAVAGTIAARADLAAAKIDAAAARSAKLNPETPMVTGTDQAAQDALRFSPQARAAAEAPIVSTPLPAIHVPGEVPLPAIHVPGVAEARALMPSAEIAPAVGKLGTSAADLATRGAAVKALLPTITGRLGAPIDAGGILAAAQSTLKPLIKDTTAVAAKAVLHDAATVADVTKGISSLRKTADGQRLLTQTINVGGKSRTVGDALEAAATRRLTGGTGAGAIGANANADLFHAVNRAIDRAASTAGKTSPDSLGTAITSAGFGAPADLPSLLSRLAQTPPGAAREQIIKDTLASSTGYKSFDKAIKAAVNGQVEASVMRSMLKALGINTKATKAETLSGMIGKQGRMNWDEVKQGIPTPQEVLDNHGITAAVSETSKTIEPADVAAEAAAKFQAETAHIPDVLSPASANTSTPEGLTAMAIQRGNAFVDGLKLKVPDSEIYSKDAWLGIHRAITNTVNIGANTAKLEGPARAAFFADRYMNSIHAIEAYQRSLGRTPHLPGAPLKDGSVNPTGALYASAGQIMDTLPQDLVNRAFFSPIRTEKAAATAGKEGITIYPTTVGEGVKAAIDGRSPLEQMLQSDRVNAFQKTPEGRGLLQELAAAITEPNTLARLTELHQLGQAQALAKATKDAAAIVEPGADKVIKAIGGGGDRSNVTSVVQDMINNVKFMAPAETPSLTRDVVSQRTDNGLIAALGETGTAFVRADKRSAAASGDVSMKEALAAQQRVAARFGTQKTADGVHIAATPGSHTPADRILLGETAKNNHAFASDTENLINNNANYLAENTQLDPSSALIASEMASPIARVFGGINHMFNGAAGMPALKVLQEQGDGSAMSYSHAYLQSLSSWFFGDDASRTALGAGAIQTEALGNRMQAAGVFDHLPAQPELNRWIANTWSAISVHEKAAADAGQVLSHDQLSAALAAGREGIGVKDTGAGGALPLSASEIPFALEWKNIKDMVYAPINGPLQRIGVPMSDIVKEMQKFGFRQGDALSNFGAADIGTAAQMASIPHDFSYALMEHPLDVVANMHLALTASAIKPAIGASLSRLHSNLFYDMTAAEAKAKGWVQLKMDGPGAGIAAYTVPGAYYPRDIAEQIPYLNRFLEDKTKAMPEIFKMINPYYDAVTGVLKSSLTIMNPRHHITNNLGNIGQEVIAGTHPGYNVKQLHVMKAMGQLEGSDMSPLDSIYVSKYIGADKNASLDQVPMNPKFSDGRVTVMIKNSDGSYHKVILSPEQVGTEQVRGSAIGAHQATDRTAEGGHTMERGRMGRFLHSRLNLPERANLKLGAFSSKYDNMARGATFNATLERGSYRSLEQAYMAAHAMVHKTNATSSSMSQFERQYARRAVFFYSWTRKALQMVGELALERPAVFSAPSKFQYEMANNAGMQPESFGKPSGNDPRIPSYEANSALGPTFTGGQVPWDAGANMWGMSLSTPQIDALTTAFGGTNDFGPNNPNGPGFGTFQAIASTLNPIIKAPIELGFNTDMAGINKKGPRADIGNYLGSQTGLPYSLATIAGLTPSTNKKLNTPAENKAAQQRAFANWLTGLKLTNYTNPTATAVASKEAGVRRAAKFTRAGATPAQLKMINSLIKQGHTKKAPAGTVPALPTPLIP